MNSVRSISLSLKCQKFTPYYYFASLYGCFVTFTFNTQKKYLDFISISLGACFLLNKKEALSQGYNVRKVNCNCVYSVYTLKPVLSGRNL